LGSFANSLRNLRKSRKRCACITSRPPKSCNGSFPPSTQCREPARLLDAPKYRLARDSSGTRQLGLSSLGAPKNTSLRRSNASSTTFTSWRGEYSRRTESAVSYEEGERILAANSVALLGSLARIVRLESSLRCRRRPRRLRLVVELLARGMDCADQLRARHSRSWRQMAATFDGRPSRSGYVRCADGPSGPSCERGLSRRGEGNSLAPGTRPVRTTHRVGTRRVRCRDRRAMSSFGERATVIPVDVEWLTRLCPGDLVSLHDTRDARRVCTVKWVTDAGVARSSLTPPTLPLVLASSRPTAARPRWLARSLGTEHRSTRW